MDPNACCSFTWLVRIHLEVEEVVDEPPFDAPLDESLFDGGPRLQPRAARPHTNGVARRRNNLHAGRAWRVWVSSTQAIRGSEIP